MHGSRGNSALTSAGIVPWVSIYIVESAAARIRRRRANLPPCIPGACGAASAYRASEACAEIYFRERNRQKIDIRARTSAA